MLIYEEFKECVTNMLRNQFNGTVEERAVDKNNGIVLDGLLFRKPGQVACPTLYVQNMYQAYESGKSIDSIVSDTLSMVDNSDLGVFDVSDYSNFNRAKKKLIMCLVNAEKNAELLKQLPHIEYLDLAIIFKVIVGDELRDNLASITVRNEHLKNWNASVEELYEYAKENTPKLLPPVIYGMEELGVPSFLCEDSPMKVISNDKKVNGASVILYDGVLKKVCEETGLNELYIIPSSIHEVIALPTDSITAKDLGEMIAQVNATELSPQEILGTNCYYYSLEKDRVELA